MSTDQDTPHTGVGPELMPTSGPGVVETPVIVGAELIPYETRLDRDPRWALSEGSRHFDENSAVFAALHKITKRLNDLGIPYAVVGGIALFRHGLRRFTEDVDILVTKDDLKRIHSSLAGLGYLPPHRNSKHLRDTDLGVRIEFLTTGDYPGDGKPKPIAFPDPTEASFAADGIRYLNLASLIELKLASGMSNRGRVKDLADVQELIKVLSLTASYSEQLNPYVRAEFEALWREARTRYVRIWRKKHSVSGADSVDETLAAAESCPELVDMHSDGVFVEDIGNGYLQLVTTDRNVAIKYDMVEEGDVWARPGFEEGETGGGDGSNASNLDP